MKNRFLLFFLLFSFSFSFSQVGVSGFYTLTDAPEWEASVLSQYFDNAIEMENNDFYKEGFKVGIDYWFRLKKLRFEFLPELNYSRYTSYLGFNDPEEHQYQSNILGFQFNTNIYLFDLTGDCDCPTFSKTDPIFKKGFFVQLSPGVAYLNNRFSGTRLDEKENAIAFYAGIGVGLDLGISDFLTLTPIVRISRTFNANWKNIDEYASIDPNPTLVDGFSNQENLSNFNSIELGLRIGLRFDEMGKRY